MLDFEQIEQKLKGYPDSTLQHYKAFSETGQAEDLHLFVLEVVAFLLDQDDRKDLSGLHDTAHLRNDIGIESITIAETIFLLEDIFEVEIDNEDVIGLETVGDLKAFLNKTAGLS